VVEGTSLAIPRPGDAIAVVHTHAYASRSEPDCLSFFFWLGRQPQPVRDGLATGGLRPLLPN
jgi:hypothetical protein